MLDHRRQRQDGQRRIDTDESIAQRLERASRQCERIEMRLQLLDPRLVLQRGYALLTDTASGHPITSVRQAHAGQAVRAALADGEVDLRVAPGGANGA